MIISWDEYYMAIANLVKSRSKDPVTKVGACIVKDNRIVSTGYNGFPHKLSDNKYPWTKGNEDITKNKYFYVVHSELNAILNSKQDLDGATIYVTLFPCNECTKAIIQSGIKKVIYYDCKPGDEKEIAVRHMLQDAGIKLEEYQRSNEEIVIKI